MFPHNKTRAPFRYLYVILILSCMAVTFLPSSHADEALPRGHFEITDIEVIAINRVKKDGKTHDEKSDKLTHWIRFDVRTKTIVAVDSEDKPYKVLNPTDSTKTKLSFDKPIKRDGKEIAAGTNLLEHQVVVDGKPNLVMRDLSPLSIQSVRIYSGFEIPADTYTVTFEWTTIYGQTFSDEVKVYIDVKL